MDLRQAKTLKKGDLIIYERTNYDNPKSPFRYDTEVIFQELTSGGIGSCKIKFMNSDVKLPLEVPINYLKLKPTSFDDMDVSIVPVAVSLDSTVIHSEDNNDDPDIKKVIDTALESVKEAQPDIFSGAGAPISNKMLVAKTPEKKSEDKVVIKKKEDEEEVFDFTFDTHFVRIIRCDSINSTTAGVKSFPSKTFDIVLTDPPYGMSFVSNTRKKENRHKAILNDDTLDWLPEWLRDINRITKDDSFIYIFFSHHFLDTLIKYVKMYFGDGYKGLLIWEKENTTAGDLDSWGTKTEFIIFIKKGKKALVEVRDDNVLKFNKVVSDRHPTEKPLDLIQYILHNSARPGELVLDCFAGSGVTGEACHNEKLNCILMEFDKDYYREDINRIADSIQKPRLLNMFSDGVESRTDKYLKSFRADLELRMTKANQGATELYVNNTLMLMLEFKDNSVVLEKIFNNLKDSLWD